MAERMPRTYVIAGTLHEARWCCRERGLDPHTTVLVYQSWHAQGRRLYPEDQVIWIGTPSDAVIAAWGVVEAISHG